MVAKRNYGKLTPGTRLEVSVPKGSLINLTRGATCTVANRPGEVHFRAGVWWIDVVWDKPGPPNGGYHPERFRIIT